MQAEFIKHTLNFKFDAGTSRGVLKTKHTYILKLWEEGKKEVYGLGEAGPLKGLSVDDVPDFEGVLEKVCQRLKAVKMEDLPFIFWTGKFELVAYPSIVFALETAAYDPINGGRRIIFESLFTEGEKSLPINGLIWMGSRQFMQEQVGKKLSEGYACLKMKIGAIDFETELSILAAIREKYSPDQITLRVDANGAFSADDALEKLDRLSSLAIHSIEQPVRPRQWELMHKLSDKPKVPVALDEELIGIFQEAEKRRLLEETKPQFIVLKPTLLGGFKATLEWIYLANEYRIGWWITSALESNIGLNAIAQFTATLDIFNFPQGLGTGQLYTNNVDSPLVIEKGRLLYKPQLLWNLDTLFH